MLPKRRCWCSCHLASGARWKMERKKRTNQANRWLVAVIVLANLPIRLVESQTFLNLIRFLAPWYKIPCRKSFCKLLDQTYMKGQQLVIDTLRNKTVSLTMDLATVLNSTRHFIVCSVHYMADSQSSEMKSCTLYVSQMTARSTSMDIVESLKVSLEEFKINIDQVISTCSDRGSNVLKACRDLFGTAKVTSCVCHLIDNIVKQSISSLPILCAVLRDVKNVVSFIKKSAVAANLLRRLQIDTGKSYSTCLMPIQSIDTRWNSTLLCIRRYIVLHPFIKKVLTHPDLASSKSKPPIVPDEVVNILTEVSAILSPFEELTEIFSSSTKLRSSTVVASIKGLLLKLKSNPVTEPVATSLRKELVLKIEEKRNTVENNVVFCAANLADPRFKGLSLSKEQFHAAASMLKARMTQCETRELSPDVPSMGPEHDHEDILLSMFYKMAPKPKRRRTVHQELDDYNDNQVLPFDTDPWQWWQENSDRFPTLSLVARDLFVAQPSSVQSERIVSSINSVMRDDRSRLLSKRLGKIVFLKNLPKDIWDGIICSKN